MLKYHYSIDNNFFFQDNMHHLLVMTVRTQTLTDRKSFIFRSCKIISNKERGTEARYKASFNSKAAADQDQKRSSSTYLEFC